MCYGQTELGNKSVIEKIRIYVKMQAKSYSLFNREDAKAKGHRGKGTVLRGANCF